MCNNPASPSQEQLRELFRKLRLGAPEWIDLPLSGIAEAADMAEGFARNYPQLFWNTPSRQNSSDVNFVSNTINRLKRGSLNAGKYASLLINFLEDRNVNPNTAGRDQSPDDE